ncbi:hypothetical protein EDB81DRAFT_830526 [Dactylonectria macrodidyma]|uniref:Uncharacterized protein n=1 Tax=Dactylonectria macrodidyma TaxID=307937 RepID=A0A9P9D2E4_9HYPO|nr:hypothetical protein EDB81DRAFT_830526 [Dactylonectria macrodidyma]
MAFGEPQMPPSLASPIPPVPPGWIRQDQLFPTPPRTHPEHIRTPSQQPQQPNLDAQQQLPQQQLPQQQLPQQQHPQQQHPQQQHPQQQHPQQQHPQQQQPRAPYPHTYPPHWPGYVGPGLKGPPLNPFVSGVQQGMQAFFKENGKSLLNHFNRELGSLRTLLEEALSQWQPSVNGALVSLQSRLVDLQCTMDEFVHKTGEAHAKLREELASIQRSLEASKSRRPLPISARIACTNECHEQTEAIKEIVRETQSSVEAIRAALGSRKGGKTRPASRISGIAKTRQKSRSGRKASQGTAQEAAGAIGKGVGQKAMPCTALPERQRERSPENVKDTDRNPLPKAPGASKEPSLPASVVGKEPCDYVSVENAPCKHYQCDGCTSTEKKPSRTQPHGLRRSVRILGKK